MKKINIYILSLLLVGAFSLSSCEQLLDVNEDPINPTEATEEQLLTGLQSNFSFQVIGGIPARMAAGLTQQTEYPVVGSYDNYFITENDVDGFWNNYSYVGVMSNCKTLSEQAIAKNKNYHAAIAKIIWAQNMSMITDAFGSAPFSQAWQPELYPFPAYDTQEEIYINLHRLLDEAIAHIDDTNQAAEVPTTDDLIYGGDMQKWRKYAYGLKARLYMHLSNAPGHDAATQSQLVLDAVAQSFQSNDDNAIYQYSSQLLQENPWNQYAVSDRWNTFTSATNKHKSAVSRNRDIRLLLHMTKANTNRDAFAIPREATPETVAPSDVSTNGQAYSAGTSLLGVLYADTDSPLPWLMYSEIQFLKAEALFHLGRLSESNIELTEAVRADLQFARPFLSRISKTPLDEAILANPANIDFMIDFYLGSVETLIPNGMSANSYYIQLMQQKYIATFLSFEAYNDLRRADTDIIAPNGSVLKDRFDYDGIALRFPYPSSEWQYNPRNVGAQNVPLGFSSMLIPVWWDSAE